jgi:hypothetical protein
MRSIRRRRAVVKTQPSGLFFRMGLLLARAGLGASSSAEKVMAPLPKRTWSRKTVRLQVHQDSAEKVRQLLSERVRARETGS